MKKARGITMVTLLAVLSVAGVNGAAAQNNCPYDATGDYSYDPGRTPDYLFGGDGQITYDGTLAWYMDDIGACYNVYKDGRYLMYFPKCDIDGDGKVGIGEVYDIYYRVQPVGQGNSIAQQACIEAFAGGSFFFCPPSRYNRTEVDIQAIIGEYPATAAISDMATSGPGHLPEEHLVDALTCTTPGVFPAGLFDTLHECYLAVESRSATSNQVDVDFSNALDISNAVQEYSNLAQQFGGICAPVASGATQGDAPGFHYSKHDDQGWWFWSVRALEQCDGESCACDITYELFTHKDYPGQVAFQSETANNNGCTDLRFIDCDTTIDADSDGTPDCIDQCDYDPAKTEPGLCGCGFSDADVDQDGQPDVCGDECPSDPNKVTPGTCGCGVPDVDSDGDGLYDCVDECPHDPYPSPCGCNTNLSSGGLCCHEYLDIPCWCLDGTGDSDGDGVIECAESCPGDPNKIDPGVCGCGVPDTDTDGDGVLDCEEQCDNDPNKTVPGVCGCGVEDRDSDGDGVYDCNDWCPLDPNKTAPAVCGCGVNDTDSDGDGFADCIDNCPHDPNKSESGVCGCDEYDIDDDGDDVYTCQGDWCDNDPNKTVPAVCGCGTADVDADSDGVYTCMGDLCDQDPLKTDPGVCGCGVPETDSDGDGVPDCVDPCPLDPTDNCAAQCPNSPYSEPNWGGYCLCSSDAECAPGETCNPEITSSCEDCDDVTGGCVWGACTDLAGIDWGTCPPRPLGAGVINGVCAPIFGCEVPAGVVLFSNVAECQGPCGDQCPGNPHKDEPGICGCDEYDIDDDGDDVYTCQGDWCDNDPNKTVPAVCGCGTADVDADSDGVYTCMGDLCDQDPLKTDPGVCGCGVPETDSDGDGVPDCVDPCPLDPTDNCAAQCPNSPYTDPNWEGYCFCDSDAECSSGEICALEITSSCEWCDDLRGGCVPDPGTYDCPADVPPFYNQRATEISETAGAACVEHAGVNGPPACAQEKHATFQEDIENFLATYAFTGAVFDHTTGGGQSWQESPFTLLCMDFPDGELPYNLFDDLNACYNATPEWGTGIRYARIEFNWAVNIWELQPIYEARAATVGAFCDFDTMVSVDGNPTPMGFHVRDDGDPWRHWTVRATDTCDYFGCRCDATVSGWTDGTGTIWEDQVVNNSVFVDYEGQRCTDPRFDF